MPRRVSAVAAALYRRMAVLHAAFEHLAIALRHRDREAVHGATRTFVAAWSESYLVLGGLDVPNDQAREALRSARRALRAAGHIVDLLFADALATAPPAVQAFVAAARAEVAAALDRDRETAGTATEQRKHLGAIE